MLRFLLIFSIALSACTKKKEEETSVVEELGPSRTAVTKPATLEEWLNANTSIRDAIKLEQPPTGSAYLHSSVSTDLAWADWTAEDKQSLSDAFDRAWTWLYLRTDHLNNIGTDEFAAPLTCSTCETNLVSSPTSSANTYITTDQAKTVFFANVAHHLAVEIGQALPWSIAGESAQILHHYFNSRSLMQYYNSNSVLLGQPAFQVDSRDKYIGRASPATPRWTYAWLARNGIIKATRAETINALLAWSRDNLTHFYGAATYANMDDHWLYPAAPSILSVLSGTTSRSHGFGYWTAGCHGTIGLLKQSLRTVSIPVEPLYVCGHAQAYFPTEDKYLDHGDNPYNQNVKDSSVDISNILISSSTHSTWFTATPDFLDSANPLCDNIGKATEAF